MSRRLRQLRRADTGQSLAEFAIVLPLLLTVMFGVFEFGRFYYTRLTLQHAVREAARYAVTGNTMTDEESGEQMTRGSSIAKVIIDRTRNLGVDIESVTIDPEDGGGPEEIVRVGVNFDYELTLPLVKNIVPGNHVRFTYSTAMRNEPFSSRSGSTGRLIRKLARCERGQELAETAIVLPIILMIGLGVVEFGSAFGSQHSLTSIGREGASIAARGASLDEVNDLMIESGAEIGMDKQGGAITSRVEVEDGVPMVREQVASPGYENRSRLGEEKKPAAGLSQIAKAEGATFYVVELFLINRDRTPLRRFKGIVVPDTLYSRAVF